MMSSLRLIAKVLLVALAIILCIIIFSPSKPTRCCYVCEQPIKDTDTWCKNCAYPLDSVIIRNMKWFEIEPTYGLKRKPGQW